MTIQAVAEFLLRIGSKTKVCLLLNEFNIIGNCVTFYITQLKGDGLYLMIEIDHLKFPLSLNELPQLLGYVDRLYDILNVFKELCMLPIQNERFEEK